jgi:DNA-binding transcriptional LysR family regulator
MPIKADAANIPIDLLRTFVTAAEAGTLAQAASALGLEPTAVTDRLGKLEHVLGAEVFDRTLPGLRLSEYGKVISSYAERMLSMNDQALQQSRQLSPARPIRAGLPRWMLEKQLIEIARRCTTEVGKDRVNLRCDHTEHLMRDLSAGLLDLALLCDSAKRPGPRRMVKEWWEDMHWVKSPEVKLNRHKPIPLVSWPGSISDRLAHGVLGEAGIPYVITFTAPDFSARVAAIAGGLGVMATSGRNIGPGIEIARESFLPPLPQTRKGLYLRDSVALDEVAPVLRVLESCMRPPSATVITSLFTGRRASQPVDASY